MAKITSMTPKKSSAKKSKKTKKSKSTRPSKVSSVDNYEAEYALDTLIRAEKIKSDKKMMNMVKTEAIKRENALKGIIK